MPGVRQGSATLAAILLLILPAFARAAGEPGFRCRHVHRGTATFNPNPRGKPPLVIGDSTTLLPIPNLMAAGFSVNARGCRGFKEAVNVAAALRSKGRLPHLVLMNDYGNGGVGIGLIQEALSVLGPRRVLVLVTEYNADTGRPPAPFTDILFRARKLFPDQVAVLDWVKYSLPHHKAEPKAGAWFLPDLFHPNFTGAGAYATFLTRALPLAKDGVFPSLP